MLIFIIAKETYIQVQFQRICFCSKNNTRLSMVIRKSY